MERIIIGGSGLRHQKNCDDAVRITWVEIGWLGSVHDNGVWFNSEIYLSKHKYFDQKEYLLGDSAVST